MVLGIVNKSIPKVKGIVTTTGGTLIVTPAFAQGDNMSSGGNYTEGNMTGSDMAGSGMATPPTTTTP